MTLHSLYAVCLLGWLADFSLSMRCAVENAAVIDGGSDECSPSEKCFALVQYFGESKRQSRNFAGPSGAFLVQSQGCFKHSAAPLVCTRSKCSLALSEADVKLKPFQFCCCTGDYCNDAHNLDIRHLDPSTMRTLASNQMNMDKFLANNTLDNDALWARWADELFIQTAETEEQLQADEGAQA